MKKLLFSCLLLIPIHSFAFWVVNFGTASTLQHKKFGFAAGMGGQMVFTGSPRTTNAFFMIPHAGFRYGITPKLDAGLRLAPVPLPFATVGPGFGMNIDAKYHITNASDKTQFALVGGLGGAHVLIQGNTRLAWSPNAALLTSFKIKQKNYLTLMGRYVYLSIPSAKEGSVGNFVMISGISAGWKWNIRQNISVLPEIGAYWYEGKIANIRQAGPGFQYGLMLATSF